MGAHRDAERDLRRHCSSVTGWTPSPIGLFHLLNTQVTGADRLGLGRTRLGPPGHPRSGTARGGQPTVRRHGDALHADSSEVRTMLRLVTVRLGQTAVVALHRLDHRLPAHARGPWRSGQHDLRRTERQRRAEGGAACAARSRPAALAPVHRLRLGSAARGPRNFDLPARARQLTDRPRADGDRRTHRRVADRRHRDRFPGGRHLRAQAEQRLRQGRQRAGPLRHLHAELLARHHLHPDLLRAPRRAAHRRAARDRRQRARTSRALHARRAADRELAGAPARGSST